MLNRGMARPNQVSTRMHRAELVLGGWTQAVVNGDPTY